MARRPSPLEIIAAQLSGDVQNLADEIKTGDFAALKSFRRYFAGIYPAAGHFGGSEPFGAIWSDVPVMDEVGDFFQFFIGQIGEPPIHARLITDKLRQSSGKPLGQDIMKFLLGLGGSLLF